MGNIFRIGAMTGTTQKFNFFLLLSLCLTVGCADVQMSKGKNGKSGKVSRTSAGDKQQSMANTEDADGEKADEPVAIGGAFIVCRQLENTNLQRLRLACSLETRQGLVETASDWQGESLNPDLELSHSQGDDLYHEEFLLESAKRPLLMEDSKDIKITASFLSSESEEITRVTSDLDQALARGSWDFSEQQGDFTKAINGIRLTNASNGECFHTPSPLSAPTSPFNADRIQGVSCTDSILHNIIPDDTKQEAVNITAQEACWDIEMADHKIGSRLLEIQCHYGDSQEFKLQHVSLLNSDKLYYQVRHTSKNSEDLCVNRSGNGLELAKCQIKTHQLFHILTE